MIKVKKIEKQLRDLFPENILGEVLKEPNVPKKLKFVMYGPLIQEGWYIYIYHSEIELREIELRMFFGEADINKCYQIMAQLMFAFGIGTKITISLGTISRRSNIICSSPREYCNKKTQTDMFDPKYTLTRSTVKMLTSIAESKVAIERAKILPQQEIELRYQALMRMAHSSTAIEGNQLDINEVMALWADKKVYTFQKEINEVKNYFKALRYIEKIGSRKQPITQKVLLHIHELVTDKILTKEQCGKYRKCPIYVMKKKPGFPDQIIYTGPEEEKYRICARIYLPG